MNIDQNFVKKDKALKYYFFYVKYLFNEDKIEMKSVNSINSNIDNSKYNSRVVNINEENKRIKGKKMQLLPGNANNVPTNTYNENIVSKRKF